MVSSRMPFLLQSLEDAPYLAVDQADGAVITGDNLTEDGFVETSEICLSGTGAKLRDAGPLVHAEILR